LKILLLVSSTILHDIVSYLLKCATQFLKGTLPV
jgi:hypothetical protein